MDKTAMTRQGGLTPQRRGRRRPREARPIEEAARRAAAFLRGVHIPLVAPSDMRQQHVGHLGRDGQHGTAQLPLLFPAGGVPRCADEERCEKNARLCPSARRAVVPPSQPETFAHSRMHGGPRPAHKRARGKTPTHAPRAALHPEHPHPHAPSAQRRRHQRRQPTHNGRQRPARRQLGASPHPSGESQERGSVGPGRQRNRSLHGSRCRYSARCRPPPPQ